MMTNVYLIGAGPGDPGLLTQKGQRHLQTADVIIYDRLVNPILLHHAKQDATLIYCGKLPKHHTMRQEQINETIIAYAKQGHKVVRLKGGDPAIFGRVGEEMRAISDAGLTYDVVPGITAASAAAIYAGIPLTHREHNAHVAFATGHGRNGQLAEQDLSHLALGGTLAFYMGIENLPRICENISKNETLTELPVAIIEWGTLGRQQVLTGTLQNIEQRLATTMMANPAIILLGQVVTERQATSWFEEKPLFGKRLILATTSAADFDTIYDYTEQGAHIYVVPELANPDQRYDDVTTRTLTNQQWDGVILQDKATPSLFQTEMSRLGINETFHIFPNDLAPCYSK
ncbi:uroporphyrinogen-III C-methyltransferase [Listeria booriae]|uniref:uroporphyrinogen-III C-methyltransferase n=1 Tax=Listeria booriae TaxID=1552123 RepID=UPI0016262CF9|nr:uroporphyrinogen-III C-methyltransferase [Listeria booriae]MBC2195610.1 uroporphyrinogen-III C-methyltransferase [Listeria booriae]